MTDPTNTGQSVDLTTDNTTDLKESMATMMSEMMSVMKDDMLRQFEEYFAAPEPEAHSGDVEANSDQHSPEVADAIDSYLQNPDPNSTSSAFDELAAEFSTADKTGPAIDNKLANIISDLINDTLPKTKLDEVIDKYPRPENCESLVVPKVNKIVWQQLKQSARTTDSAMQKCQKLFTSAMYAIIQACEKVTDDVRMILTHALVLAMSGNREFNLRRRELLRPSLNAKYTTLCNPSTPITSELFGDDISKEIDQVAKANQLGNKLSNSRRGRAQRYHPYAGSPSPSYSGTGPTRGHDNRVSVPRSFSSFFGGRGSYRRRMGAKMGATQTKASRN